jgi:hypothetical protein
MKKDSIRRRFAADSPPSMSPIRRRARRRFVAEHVANSLPNVAQLRKTTA